MQQIQLCFLECSGILKCYLSAVGKSTDLEPAGTEADSIYENDDFMWPIVVLIFKIVANCFMILLNIIYLYLNI